jgi:hypothetical protein
MLTLAAIAAAVALERYVVARVRFLRRFDGMPQPRVA